MDVKYSNYQKPAPELIAEPAVTPQAAAKAVLAGAAH
jgi:hypothetical protein